MSKLIEIEDATGERRLLMPHNQMRIAKMAVPFLGDDGAPPVVPWDQLTPTDFPTQEIPDIKDQDGIGACNAFDTINVMEMTRAREGLPYVKLSPGYLYGNINGGQDQGSSLEDAVTWMMQTGTVPASIVPELVWQKNKWPKNVDLKAEAAKYKLLEVYRIGDAQGVFSALYHGFVVSLGVVWCQKDNAPANGTLDVNPGKELGGHAFCCYKVSSAGTGVKTKARCRNQWGPQYALKGEMDITRERLEAEASNNFGWWAARVVSWSGGDIKPPVA